MKNQWAIDKIVETLRCSIRVCKHDLFNAVALSGRDAEMALWEAREAIRKSDGLVFGPLAGHPGHIHRLNTKRIVQHAGNQRRRGYKAIVRSLNKLQVATDTATDAASRELASRAEARAHMRAKRPVLKA